MRVLILGLQQDWIWTDKRIGMTTSEIRYVNEVEACCQRFMTIPGMGGYLNCSGRGSRGR
jgi:transposase